MFKPVRQHVTGPAPKKRPKRKRRPRRGYGPEAEQQKAFVEIARAAGLLVQHCKQGSGNKLTRINDWRLGCTGGAADLVIFDRLPKAPTARGLALEFKAETEQSADQKTWETRIMARGWRYHVVWSCREAVEVCEEYGLTLRR